MQKNCVVFETLINL